jgi:selenocysteine-specific translation elongation factor
LRVEPRGLEVRVRSVQVHDAPVARADAGQRVAVALPGIERSQVRRGEALVAAGAYAPSYRLDVELTGDVPTHVHVHHGTAEHPARVISVGGGPARRRLPLLGVERRGPDLWLAGAAAALDEEAATVIEEQLAVEPLVKVQDRELALYLEKQGRLRRVGDGFAVSPARYDRGRDALPALAPITIASFRDALGISRRTAQLLLERYDADGLTRRVGDERVLRRRSGSGPMEP